jgi:hypothetical protein
MVERVDQFIKNVATYGVGRIKLIVALHDFIQMNKLKMILLLD